VRQGRSMSQAEQAAGRGRGFRLASPGAALVVAVVMLALLLAQLPLSGLARQSLSQSNGGVPALVVLPFAIVGFVLAWRKPGNRLGWIFFGLAASGTVAEDASFYVVACYRVRHGTLPFGWVALLLQPAWSIAIVLMGLAVLLFPDGRLPSPRLRWLLWVYLAVGTVWMVSAFSFTVSAIVRHDIQVDSGGNLRVLSDPTGSAAWWGVVQTAVFAVIAVSVVASLVGQVASYRRSSGERRQQLKWLLGGFGLTGACLGLAVVLGSGLPSSAAVVAAYFAVPVCVGVAILKYRLYDIDRIISRTLAYAIVTGLLVGLYAGLVLLATEVLRVHTPVAVAAATLAAAALFSPVRRRVQRLVDRRFNRARYDADRTVAAFAARLQDAVDLDSVRADLAGVVQAALEPAHLAVWIQPRD
jgi:hypothetical protein